MNQIPASILILTSSILAFSVTTGTSSLTTDGSGMTTAQTTPVGILLGLASLVLGIWGVISLVNASIRDREMVFEGSARSDVLAMFDPRRAVRPYQTVPQNPVPVAQNRVSDPAAVVLSPELKAQLSMASHLEGKDRSQIVEEALRRYLPRYENSTKAA